MFSLICAWINGWVNNGDAGDLRRNRAHYDVTVIVGNFFMVELSEKSEKLWKDTQHRADIWVEVSLVSKVD